MEENKVRARPMWGLSILSWDFLALLFGVFAVGALYVSAIHASKRIAEANERASAAEERAAALEKEATQARAAIAEAQARQKEAEERTEVLRESLARNVMPRTLSPAEFENELKSAPTSSVEILYDSNVTDAFNLATSMMIALAKAHWNIQSKSPLRVAALSTIPRNPLQEYRGRFGL
jgi:hypothetical protein